MPPLSELTFGSLLAYSPRGQSAESQRSKKFGLQLKGNRIVAGKPPLSAAQYLARHLRGLPAANPLAGYFTATDLLVPVPPSSLLKPNTVWPALAIAEAMVAEGLGGRVERCLQRRSALRKSAYAARGERPTIPEHLESLVAVAPFLSADRVMLVDDVVTKGTTLLACAMAVADLVPGVEIAGFAAFRTLGLQPEIDRLADPCVGKIWVDHGDVHREP